MSIVINKTLPFSQQSLQIIQSQLAALEWSVLMGCPSQHQDSQFEIFTANPIATITTFGQNSEVRQVVEGQWQTRRSKEDPLTLVKALRHAVLPDVNQQSLPFYGGVLGAFSYDLGRRFETLPQQAEHDIAMPDMAVGIYDWALLHDLRSHQLTLVTIGEQCQQKAQQIETWLHQLVQQGTTGSPFSLTTPWLSNMDKASYANKFQSVKDYLLSGDCYQVNLAQRFSAQYTGDEFEAYQRLLNQNQAPFSCFMRLPSGCILSISPERFLKLEQGNIETKPIKGTRPRSKVPSEDHALKLSLQQAEKDQAENLMIVDLLRNDIGRVSKPGSVAVPSLFDIESFPAVHHLVSTVTGQLDSAYEAEDLLRACFPGGSITGAPKIRAMEIIDQLEPHQRSFYCGSLGYISANGNMDTNIAIRTLVCHQGQVHCWVGGGLVADSLVDDEYQETFDKVSKILPVLADEPPH
ncbi:aminodeoxychorismate synthase component I [Motilimonas pumila]|uniref:aminodeoxychorismate synthase n=1 Tax=Motilimonas pumila TaxID=2303987 RepID=A0A418YFM1_9GAMM|nr:aminodeoxychorismate synthase component I [Motilimonas pumila]RJG48121.1 aminodeoxychorismate synthase component I [Motilimonas pumila]